MNERTPTAPAPGPRTLAGTVRLLAVCLLLLPALPAWSKAKASKSKRSGNLSEDSLQSLVAQEPENPSHWMELGSLAARNGQVDLAKGYFDEAIKLSGRSGGTILQVGGIWLTLGKVQASLPYLMPNLAHLDSSQLDLLQSGLEKEKMPSVRLNVLRHLAARTPWFHPVHRKAAALAFRLDDHALCQALLARSHEQLDYESARNLLLVNFFLGGSLEPKVISALVSKHSHAEITLIAALNHAQAARWREAKSLLAREAKSPSFRDYYHLGRGLQATSEDRPEDAAAHLENALQSRWDRLRAAVYADLFRLYSITGNKFKADQVWETLKEEYQAKEPDLQEFMGRQMLLRGYEKQAKYFYRVALRKRPGSLQALGALWEDLLDKEDDQAVQDHLEALLDRDPWSCQGNTLAMDFHYRKRNEKELIPFARNATVYCYETLEPYYILGTTLLSMSKPDEARQYFATYIRKGGDANRVPLNLR